MANIYRKTYRKDLPDGAEIRHRRGKAIAHWTDGNGRKRTADLSADGQKILIRSTVWYARYRDADGIERRVSTGCRDEQAARQVLADLLAEVEKVRAGILTPQEMQAARQGDRPLREHFDDYLEYLKAKTVRGRPVSRAHRDNVARQLATLAGECSLRWLGDITRQKLVRWINAQTDAGERSARTINTYRAALVAFCNWAVQEGRLITNPLSGLPKADQTEKRRERRALSPEEVKALLEAARTRPLQDALTVRTGPNTGKLLAKVRPSEQERLRRLGRERELMYRTLIYTGLRKGELASLTVGDMHLDEPRPYAVLRGRNAKNARSAHIPLRQDLAEQLRGYLAEKLSAYRMNTLADGRRSVPMCLPADMKVFNVPRALIRTFDRDLAAAGIPKEDEQGRTVDVHALRHTFATMLSKARVAPRMAQELLRHGDIRLTMNTYTHLEMVDVQKAVETLPDFSAQPGESEAASATGTDGGDGSGAGIGAVIGAERQETGGNRRHALSRRRPERGTQDESQVHGPDKDRHELAGVVTEGNGAGEGIRTLDTQHGKLVLYR